MWIVTEDERHALEASWLSFAIKRADMQPVAAWWRELDQRYSEPHRHYHTHGHIRDMLQLVYGEAATAAAWFHDIVYDPTRSDNEAASAGVAAVALRELGFTVLTTDVVTQLIRATETHEPRGLPPQALSFLDADLAILGSPRDRYAEYREAIRREYAFFSDDEFRERRRAFLDRFLTRRRIYLTDTMRDRYESNARANIEWELAKWGTEVEDRL